MRSIMGSKSFDSTLQVEVESLGRYGSDVHGMDGCLEMYPLFVRDYVQDGPEKRRLHLRTRRHAQF